MHFTHTHTHSCNHIIIPAKIHTYINLSPIPASLFSDESASGHHFRSALGLVSHHLDAAVGPMGGVEWVSVCEGYLAWIIREWE